MMREMEEEGKKADAEFRSMVFAASPKRYFELFEEEKRRVEEEEIEWVRPNPDDLEETLSSLGLEAAE